MAEEELSVSHVVYQKVAGCSVSSADWLLWVSQFPCAKTRFFTLHVPFQTNMPRNSPSVSHLKACFEQHPLIYLPFLPVKVFLPVHHQLLSLCISFSFQFGFLF